MDRKAAANELSKLALEKQVRFPKIWDESQRLQECGKTIMMHKNEDNTFDLQSSLSDLIDRYGMDHKDQSSPSENKTAGRKKRKSGNDEENKDNDEIDDDVEKKTKKKSIHVTCEENRPIAEAIGEMAGIYFKNGDPRKGGVFSKAAKAIRDCETVIRSGKEAMKLNGIGKGIASHIDEYFTNGFMPKLEELRAGTA